MPVNVNDIAPPAGNEAWKPEIGEKIQGTIVYADTYQRENYDDPNIIEENMRVDLEDDNGDTTSVYAIVNTNIHGDGYAKALAKAISAAVRQSGANALAEGGTLAIVRIDDKEPTKKGYRGAKQYQAEYQPPTENTNEDIADGAVTGLIGN